MLIVLVLNGVFLVFGEISVLSSGVIILFVGVSLLFATLHHHPEGNCNILSSVLEILNFDL